ncbi:class I SAM-dependent methyltransferase [Prosthecobacter dejongeii]|uniref:SAM-dependent methyltransferase n=1 Tax=Prosthecobacter dejongeii TaxID=48465 RepID=A0A7W8DS15_9BACT|nr:methyltransferase domain-containing protein [Prosthecobacter dejongeii]MBB5039890.1 SAM-dependent methyltransferase [Prosthecobacter dejongeii]
MRSDFHRKPTGSRTPPRPGPRPAPGRGPASAPRPDRSQGGTSWEKSADWYDRILGERGSELYQAVVIPQSLALLKPQKGERILDLGCGQGVFSRAMADKGAQVTGVDAAPTLIVKARTYPSRTPIRYYDRDAAQLNGLGEFDAASAILCLQNMEHLDTVIAATATVLKPGGRMLWVLNHPAFRIPRQSSWGNEEDRKIQYRRVDAYSSTLGIPILMHPGKADSESTVSFHRSFETLCSSGFKAGLTMAGLGEWYSHKESQPGPRARAENRARKEFPLFLALLWQKPFVTAPV